MAEELSRPDPQVPYVLTYHDKRLLRIFRIAQDEPREVVPAQSNPRRTIDNDEWTG